MSPSETNDGVTLSSFMRTYLGPTFRAAGGRAKGRRYEFVNELGDVRWFDLYSRGWQDGAVGFDAAICVNPAPAREWWQWHQREVGYTDFVVTPTQSPLWSASLLPPATLNMHGHWGFDSQEGAAACGNAIDDMLMSWALATLVRAGDRRAFLDGIIADTLAPPGRQRYSRTLDHVIVLLTIDDGPSPVIDEALAAIERDRDHLFVRWARQRLGRSRELIVP